jgi:hypothetical protein
LKADHFAILDYFAKSNFMQAQLNEVYRLRKGLPTSPFLKNNRPTNIHAIACILLKALQQQLTCTTLLWRPGENTQLRYLINEITLQKKQTKILVASV